MNAPNKAHCIVLKDGKFDKAEGTTADDLHNVFAAIGQSDKTAVVVHFHGGLVDKQAGIDAANVLTPIYENASAYPLFFIWESGWREVLEQNLPAIFKENIFQAILARVSQFAKGKVDKGAETGQARSAGTLTVPKEHHILDELQNPADGVEPFAAVDPHSLPEGDALTEEEREQFEEALKEDPVFEELVAEISGSLTPADAAGAASRSATVRGSTKTLMCPDVLAEIAPGEEGAKGVVSTALVIARSAVVLGRVIQRFAQRRGHGFYLTIVEEIMRGFYVGNAGRFLWNGMKQDTSDAFGVDPECGGTLFVTALEKLWKEGERPRLTLVGHSAGAIYVCRLLQEVQARGLPPDLHFNVILIAPACDFNLLAKTLQSVATRIDDLRVFGMGDQRERADAIAGILYPSSLLYFVSGVVEKESDQPLAGMERFYAAPYDDAGKFPDIDFVRNSAQFQKDHALVWAESTSGEGINCDMTTHGGWAAAQATVASVTYILQKGYGRV